MKGHHDLLEEEWEHNYREDSLFLEMEQQRIEDEFRQWEEEQYAQISVGKPKKKRKFGTYAKVIIGKIKNFFQHLT